MTLEEKREKFIADLAEYLTGNSAAKSMSVAVETRREACDMRPVWASEWAQLRQSAGVYGWVDKDEAIEILNLLLK